MNCGLFQDVKNGLSPKLADVLQNLLPGGRIMGKEYVCASLSGGRGNSCRTNLNTGVGSDFATGDSWSDVISLAAEVWQVGQMEAAQKLGLQYNLSLPTSNTVAISKRSRPPFRAILPVPPSAPKPPLHHPQHGSYQQIWAYTDSQGQILAYVVRFEGSQGKTILPLSYGQYGTDSPGWAWKALPEPRPLYGLHHLSASSSDRPVLLVEGEKTVEAALKIFPEHVVMTWSGGANAVSKADFSPLQNRAIIIWPDNDEAGFSAALKLAEILSRQIQRQNLTFALPPQALPKAWDLADQFPPEFQPQDCLVSALNFDLFAREATSRYPNLISLITVIEKSKPDHFQAEFEEFDIKEWPVFSKDAYPGFLGEFVELATRDSEADPAAVCITVLARFCAEVYGHSSKLGPHIYVGETIHPPRLFAVICGNSSKARKGTSRHPVVKLFGREHISQANLASLGLHLPARESGGPLSTGEGLAYYVRDESDEERDKWQRQNPNEVIREKSDKRLMIFDEEFASGLACTRREGNTLSMGIRCFWDSGDYAPLTKNNPVIVRGAHINIVTHITMQELAAAFGEIQAVNGFGNRFLWICARRSKLVAWPSRMPEAELAPMQRELWRLVSLAQNRGTIILSERALALWQGIYPKLSQEHNGFTGSLINRAEAQTLRLALAYALLAGAAQINEEHLHAALAMWRYAQESALYIFGDRSANPLEEKVMEILRAGPLSSTELSAALNRNIPKEKLQPILQQLESQRRLTITKQKSGGRPRQVISLFENKTAYEINEKNEIME